MIPTVTAAARPITGTARRPAIEVHSPREPNNLNTCERPGTTRNSTRGHAEKGDNANGCPCTLRRHNRGRCCCLASASSERYEYENLLGSGEPTSQRRYLQGDERESDPHCRVVHGKGYTGVAHQTARHQCVATQGSGRSCNWLENGQRTGKARSGTAATQWETWFGGSVVPQAEEPRAQRLHQVLNPKHPVQGRGTPARRATGQIRERRPARAALRSNNGGRE